jgi:hypothetical protein
MDQPITPEDMALLHPELFRIKRGESTAKTVTTFAEQHAAALAAFDAPQHRSPSVCSPEDRIQSGKASPT